MYFSGYKTESKQKIAIIVSRKTAAFIFGYHCVNSKIISVKLSTKPINLNIIQVYASTSKASKKKIEFYLNLEKEILRTPVREMTVIVANFNAKVGSVKEFDDYFRNILEKSGLGERDKRGELLLSFCAEKELTIANIMFTHHPRRLYT